MIKTRLLKSLSLILCCVLIAAMALFATGCKDNDDTNADNSANAAQTSGDVTVMGEGEIVFNLTVVDKDGNETKFEIHTNKTVVGEALLELGLISGDEGAYGIFIKTVNGITADYGIDGTYWAFYIGGEYATSGVDKTDVVAGETYTLKVEG